MGGTWPAGRSAGEAKTAALATNPGGEVGPLAVLDDDRHGGSEESAGHPTRALPPRGDRSPWGRRGGGGGSGSLDRSQDRDPLTPHRKVGCV